MRLPPFVFAIAFVASIGVGCAGSKSADDCSRMASHVVDIQLATMESRADADPRVERELRAHRKNLVAVNAGAVEQCRINPDKAFMRCALSAEDPAQLAKCQNTQRSNKQ